MRWWWLAAGGVLLAWVLGTAYVQARRRGRRIGLALLFLAFSALCYVAAVFFPRPPVTDAASQALVIASIVLLASSMAVVLWHGFRA